MLTQASKRFANTATTLGTHKELRCGLHGLVLVFNRQHGTAGNHKIARRIHSVGKPDTINFLVSTVDLGFESPHGRFLCRYPTDSNDAVVFAIHPDFTVNRIFVSTLGYNLHPKPSPPLPA